MKFVALLIFTSAGFVLSALKRCETPSTKTLYAYENTSEDIEHKISKKSITNRPSTVENNENHDEAIQEPCRLSLSYLEELSAADMSQDLYVDDSLQDLLPMDVIPPKLAGLPTWTPYDLEYLTRVPVQDRSSYSSYNMLSPAAPVISLPPMSTRIYETIPDDDEGYDPNGISDNELLYPPYVRSVRSRDDFFGQLQTDATFPNILPTMPFPYMRSSATLYHYGQDGPMVALFSRSGSDCALPFLVSCSPEIAYGILKQNAYGETPMHFAPNALDQTADVIHDVKQTDG